MANKSLISMLFVISLIFSFNIVESAPTNSMTRIQEVLRTLMGSKPHLASRGKKFYRERPIWEPYSEYDPNI
uniref:Uncharacterized protein n=1 Tax=Panagrolaimus sp. JU765 TaxID=591449 RepID=A0AC34QBR6_9BILA